MSDLFESKAAVISDCGKFRYRLDRKVAEAGPVYAFFGVNPSTADAALDDATVRKWRGFVSRWGGSRFVVGNVFAYRSTDVKGLSYGGDPIGPLNLAHIHEIVAEADILVPCWGNRDKLPTMLRTYPLLCLNTLLKSGKPVMTFGLTNAGDPKHPLMLGYDTTLLDLAA